VRIVAVADTHLFHGDLKVPDGDLFIHAGDLCRRGTLEELKQAVDWIRSLPHPRKLVVAGNHDWAFVDHPAQARALLDGVGTYLEDGGATIDGLTVWGSPWQPAFNDWAFNLPRGEPLAKKWSLIPGGLDVLVTHGPPAGYGDATSMGRERSGCADLLGRVRVVKPRLHLFGHIHEDGGCWTAGDTTFVNCTTWECERAPTVIEITPDAVSVSSPPSRR
jgi:predicted phosphodiesterase